VQLPIHLATRLSPKLQHPQFEGDASIKDVRSNDFLSWTKYPGNRLEAVRSHLGLWQLATFVSHTHLESDSFYLRHVVHIDPS
jgi:hypothetical protein